MIHRSRTGTAKAKATATATATAVSRPVLERRCFFGVASIVSRWAAARNRPRISEPRIGRSGEWRIVSAVATTNRIIPPTRNRDFGRNDGSSIRMLYTGGGKGGGGGGDKCERAFLQFLERLRLFDTSGPMGRSVHCGDGNGGGGKRVHVLYNCGTTTNAISRSGVRRRRRMRRRTSGIGVLILLSERGE